jgi:hypothetical protein
MRMTNDGLRSIQSQQARFAADGAGYDTRPRLVSSASAFLADTCDRSYRSARVTIPNSCSAPSSPVRPPG